VVSVAVSAAAAVGGACGASTPAHRGAMGPPAPAPLSAPRTSPTQDSEYLADVAKADPTLATYIQQQGDVGLRAVLTDGTAFCAFLQRGGGIDDALVSVAMGARSVEAQTQLPETVTTFNTMEAVALLKLCPSDQRLVPASVRSRVDALGAALGR